MSQRLLGDFSLWSEDAMAAEDARIALDYKLACGDTGLGFWTHDQVDDFFLGYLPAKVLLSEEQVGETVEAICSFFDFLEDIGELTEDSDPARELVAHAESHIAEIEELMADPSTGGPSKRILMAMLDDGVDIEDGAAVSEWIEAFNAGPVEARDAILGLPPEPGIVVPPRPPVDTELARRSAAGAPIFSKFSVLAGYMGEGRRLTDRGNIKLADARELIELLETGDVMEETIGDKLFRTRSSANLLWLDMIVWWARTVWAVKVAHKRMSATKKWQRRAAQDPREVMREAAAVVFDTGPLVMLWGDRGIWDPVDPVLDAAPVSLLASLYEEESGLDELVDRITEMISELVSLPDWYLHEDEEGGTFLERSVRSRIQKVVRIMEMAGLICWQGGERHPDRYRIGEVWRGGTLSITPFGEWMVQNHLPGTGMVSAPIIEPLTVTLEDSPEQIVVALAARLRAGSEPLVAAWEQLGGREGLPEQLWRVDDPETAPLLEALGATLPDKAAAKAARKALLKHRSWMAGRS